MKSIELCHTSEESWLEGELTNNLNGDIEFMISVQVYHQAALFLFGWYLPQGAAVK